MPRPSRLASLALLLAAAAPAATAQNQPPRRPPERTVYVPIEDFDQIFDREKGGVFVPYQELLRLLERANAQQPTQPPRTDLTPPADVVLVGCQLRGQAGERVVQFDATFDIEVLEGERWVVIPIGLAEASLESVSTPAGRAVVGPMATIAAQLARQPQPQGARPREPLPTTGYGIITKGAGKVLVNARFAVPISSKPGESSFGLSLPGAALCKFDVALPQSGLRVRVDNALATEETSVAQQEQTNVKAYFGAGARAAVTWNPRPKEVEGSEQRQPLVFADTETSLRLDEGVLQTTTRIYYRILQAPCGEFRVQFPKGYTLLGVRGENMSAPPVPEQGADSQTIVVRLHDKAKDGYALEVRLEKILGEGTSELEFPRIATVGTERESGMLAARTSEFLTLEPSLQTGVSQIDAAGLTTTVKPNATPADPTLASDLRWSVGQPRPPLGFRYLRQPYALKLKTTRVEPEVEGKVFTLAMVKDDETALATTVRYTIRKRGIFSVRVRLPQGYITTDVGDERIVKDWRKVDATAEEKAQGLGDVLVVDFVSQIAPGTFVLPITGRVARTPMAADARTEQVTMPRLRLMDVIKETGVLAVGNMTHLRLAPGAVAGLVSKGARELPALSFPYAAGAGEELPFGYTYSKPDGVAATFTVEKREPKVTARVETLVDAQEDLVKVEIAVNYLVEYAGVEQLRVEVPLALKDQKDLQIEGDGIQDKRMEEKEGKAVWSIGLMGKRTGPFTIRLKYDIKLDGFQAGQQKDVTLHEVKVLDCFSETGDIALIKHENLVIADRTRESIERRDPRELPEALRARGPIQAFRYVSHPNSLTLQLTKYNFQAPLGILVDHLHVDEVIGSDGTLKAEAYVLLQNAANQFLTVVLPPGAEVRGLQVDGKNEEWSTGDPTDGRPTIQVHLGEITKVKRDAPFLVRIRYNVAGAAKIGSMGALDLFTPLFPLADDKQVPVARLTRSLFLPEDHAYLDFDTDATKHFDDTSLWEDVKRGIGVRAPRVQASNAWQVKQAITSLKATSSGEVGLYPALELPSSGERLFEKLDSPSRLSVRYAGWSVFYFLDVLALVGVIALGLVLEKKGVARLMPFVGLAAAGCVLGATFLGRAWEPYFASGLVGAAGLAAFGLVRGAWRELTVERHARRKEELALEAQAALARAQAAEAEARARGAAPAGPTVSATPKGSAPTAEDHAAADRIQLDPPGGPSAAPGA